MWIWGGTGLLGFHTICEVQRDKRWGGSDDEKSCQNREEVMQGAAMKHVEILSKSRKKT